LENGETIAWFTGCMQHEVVMGKLIQFYVPQAIIRTRRPSTGKPVGKLIEFPRAYSKKTA
jgi:hypothetical protein